MKNKQQGFIDPNYKGVHDEPDLPRPPMTNKDRVILLVIAITSVTISVAGGLWLYHFLVRTVGHIIY